VKEKIKKMFIWDSTLLIIFTVLMWTILFIVRNNIGLMIEDISVKMFMNIIWMLVLMFGTMALGTVFIHLKNHKERIYKEDIKNGEECINNERKKQQ